MFVRNMKYWLKTNILIIWGVLMIVGFLAIPFFVTPTKSQKSQELNNVSTSIIKEEYNIDYDATQRIRIIEFNDGTKCVILTDGVEVAIDCLESK